MNTVMRERLINAYRPQSTKHLLDLVKILDHNLATEDFTPELRRHAEDMLVVYLLVLSERDEWN